MVEVDDVLGLNKEKVALKTYAHKGGERGKQDQDPDGLVGSQDEQRRRHEKAKNKDCDFEAQGSASTNRVAKLVGQEGSKRMSLIEKPHFPPVEPGRRLEGGSAWAADPEVIDRFHYGGRD